MSLKFILRFVIRLIIPCVLNVKLGATAGAQGLLPAWCLGQAVPGSAQPLAISLALKCLFSPLNDKGTNYVLYIN